MSTAGADLRRWWRRTARYRPRTATGWIVAVTVAFYVLQLLTQGLLQAALQYVPLYSLPRIGAPFEPWRMLTSILIHQPITVFTVFGITHIAFNMYSLYLFGRPLESVIGSGRLVAIYLICGLAGSVAVLYASLVGLLSPASVVYGASGAVFGVLGAVVVIQRRLGIDVRVLYVFIAINFVLAFVLGGVAWEAHLGGLLVGALLGWLFIHNRGPRRTNRAIAGAAGITAVVLVLALLPTALVG